MLRPSSPSPPLLADTIADVWRSVLKIDHIEFDDNFFDRGGNSLLLMAAHSRLQEVLQTKIPITDLFEFATIRALADHLAKDRPARLDLNDTVERSQKQRAVFARQRKRWTERGP
jgi:acyl carrier protein